MDEVRKQYLAAEQDMKKGLSGADRWYEYQKNTLAHLVQLVSILESPDVTDGAQIKLRNDKAFSPLRRAVESKLAEGASSKEADFLAEMTKMLGGGLG